MNAIKITMSNYHHELELVVIKYDNDYSCIARHKFPDGSYSINNQEHLMKASKFDYMVIKLYNLPYTSDSLRGFYIAPLSWYYNDAERQQVLVVNVFDERIELYENDYAKLISFLYDYITD